MPAKKTCFMIQPLWEPYDTRFDDTYKLAIEAASLVADRVDKDDAVNKIVPAIHEKIKKAAICLAEISTDRPNVWYEIGYAIAHGKPMVYVCDSPRKTNLPLDFELQKYIPLVGKTKTAFSEHEKKITDSIRAKLKNSKRARSVAKNGSAPKSAKSQTASVIGKLSQLDIDVLTKILNHYVRYTQPCESNLLMEDGNRAWAINCSLKTLEEENLIDRKSFKKLSSEFCISGEDDDFNYYSAEGFIPTEKGSALARANPAMFQ